MVEVLGNPVSLLSLTRLNDENEFDVTSINITGKRVDFVVPVLGPSRVYEATILPSKQATSRHTANMMTDHCLHQTYLPTWRATLLVESRGTLLPQVM